MNEIVKVIGEEATVRLEERYGRLMDHIGVEVQGPQTFKMELKITDYKQMSDNPTCNEKERTLGVGLAEIEYCLYHFLDFGERNTEEVIHLNNNLPKNGIHMHPNIYAELTGSERESMRRIEERIKNFLHLDYPCGKTTGYYAKVMLLRSTGNFLYTLQGHPVASHREFSS